MNQFHRLRDDIAAEIIERRAEMNAMSERIAVLQSVLGRLNAALVAEAHDANPVPEPVERREKRDIRAAVIAVLKDRDHLSAPMIRAIVEQEIGSLTDSALARTLSSLVGDGKVVERDGVFSLPPAVRVVPEAAQ